LLADFLLALGDLFLIAADFFLIGFFVAGLLPAFLALLLFLASPLAAAAGAAGAAAAAAGAAAGATAASGSGSGSAHVKELSATRATAKKRNCEQKDRGCLVIRSVKAYPIADSPNLKVTFT